MGSLGSVRAGLWVGDEDCVAGVLSPDCFGDGWCTVDADGDGYPIVDAAGDGYCIVDAGVCAAGDGYPIVDAAGDGYCIVDAGVCAAAAANSFCNCRLGVRLALDDDGDNLCIAFNKVSCCCET